MAVDAVSSTGGSQTIDATQSGFNGLNADSFLKLLIAQLKNQDPLEPVGNQELLQQLSTMRGLQSNIELSQSLKSLTLNQQISAGAGFLDKVVTGTLANQQEVTGVVDRVVVKDGTTYVGIGEHQVAVDQITKVAAS